MLNRTQISIFMGLSLFFWIVSLALYRVPMTWEMLAPFGMVVSALSLVLLIFEVWAWQLPLINGWIIQRPVLHGTWKTLLHSDWINPETNAGIPAIECFIVVRQTASKLSIRIVTRESRSETVSTGIERCMDGTFEVSCTYRNKPKSIYRHRSEVHYGAMLLAVEGLKPSSIEGEYWTDRKTTGSVVLSERKSQTAMTFEDAEVLFA